MTKNEEIAAKLELLADEADKVSKCLKEMLQTGKQLANLLDDTKQFQIGATYRYHDNVVNFHKNSMHGDTWTGFWKCVYVGKTNAVIESDKYGLRLVMPTALRATLYNTHPTLIRVVD